MNDNTGSNNNVSVNHSITLGSAGTLMCALMLSACTGGVGVVQGQVDLVDLRQGTLLSGDLEAANGTYGALCTDRTGDWSLEIETGAGLANPELSVVLDDIACVLTLTELQTTAGTITALPDIDLTAAYEASASAFGDPVDFYANTQMSSVLFASDFVLSLAYSDDPTLVDGDAAAAFEAVQTTVTATSIQAPTYTINTTGLTILTNSEQVVQSATGVVTFSAAPTTAGQFYVVVDDSGLLTYADLDDAYDLGTPVAVGNVPAASFTLTGEDLDSGVIRTLIVANFVENVAAYQAFEITFNPAT